MSFLSKRLSAIKNLVKPNNQVCDIGTDHALLLIDLIKDGKTPYAYALDIALGPLKHAQRNIELHSLEDKIEIIQSNGLENFDKKADTYVLAGMGAETILQIIKDYDFDFESQIILQSNTKHSLLRTFLSENGFEITNEIFLYDKKIPVFIFEVYKRAETLKLDSCDIYLGESCFYIENKEYRHYLEKRLEHFESFLSKNPSLQEEYQCIKKRLESWQYYE